MSTRRDLSGAKRKGLVKNHRKMSHRPVAALCFMMSLSWVAAFLASSNCSQGDAFCDHITPGSYCKHYQPHQPGRVCHGSDTPCHCGPSPPIPKCNYDPMDVCVMIDGSGSVESSTRGGNSYQCQTTAGNLSAVVSKCPNYGSEVQFIANFMEAFDGHLGSNAFKISANAFSGNYSLRPDLPAVRQFFGLDGFTSAVQMVEANIDWSYPTGATFTREAAEHCLSELTNSSGARGNARKMIIMLTDGKPWPSGQGHEPDEVFKAAKAAGVLVAIVAVGEKYLDNATLANMNSWASNGSYYALEGMNAASMVGPLVQKTCE